MLPLFNSEITYLFFCLIYLYKIGVNIKVNIDANHETSKPIPINMLKYITMRKKFNVFLLKNSSKIKPPTNEMIEKIAMNKNIKSVLISLVFIIFHLSLIEILIPFINIELIKYLNSCVNNIKVGYYRINIPIN